jgi:acyl-CoA dehydrogenase
MIFAMHQIQVACVVHHALGSEFFKNYVRSLVKDQLLMASSTTELGVGGDVRSSICAAVIAGEVLTLEKQAPVISYGEAADTILVTCRKSPEAPRGDQVHVLVNKKDFQLKRLSEWNTLGFRGTCSNGFVLTAKCHPEQVLPVPYAEIHSKTMHPFSHSVWASLWLGIANEAVSRARSSVRAEARRNPGTTPPTALRLAELDSVLFTMRGGTHQAIAEYHQLLDENDPEAFSSFSFATRTSNLKITASQLVVEIVGKAMLICGIAAYRNDSKLTLGRLLRDAYGAALMVSNDRILGQSSTLQVAQRD